MESNKKIVLISIYNNENNGIRSIYYQLLSRGYDVYLIYFGKFDGINTKSPSKKDYRLLMSTLKEINPSIVGMSMLTFAFEIAVDITKEMKGNLNPLILFGGIHARIRPDECIKYADVVCEWEGEESVMELCDKFFSGEDYSNVPNLWVKKGGKVFKNPIKLIKDLNKLALPDFKSKNFIYVNGGNIVRGEWQLIDGCYSIATSRGCPHRCTYCINSTFTEKLSNTPYKGKYVRRRNVDNVIEELKLVKDHFRGIKRVNIIDEILPIDLDWLEKFSEAYRNKIRIPFWYQLHPVFANERAISLLKKTGAVQLAMGIESASQRVREEVYKRYTPNKMIFDAVKLMKKYEIGCDFNIIMNNPFETDEDLRDGVEFLLSLPRPISLRFYSLTNYPSTELTAMLLKSGLIEKADTSFADSFAFRVSKKQPFKNVRDQYWFYIFNFIPKPYIPKFLILFLTKDIFVKNHRLLIGIFKVGLKLYQLKDNFKVKLVE